MSFPLEKLKLLPSKRETFFFAFLDVSDHLEAKIKNKLKTFQGEDFFFKYVLKR